ncbi:MAG: tetratricopeptide repeat protein [Polaribacter sp.]
MKHHLKSFLLVIVFCFLVFNQKTKAQGTSNQKKDSLIFYIKKAKEFIKKDTEDSVVYYNNKLAPFGKDKDLYKEYLNFISELGHYYEGSGSFEKSIEVYENALIISEYFEDYNYTSKIFYDMSQTYRIFHDYRKAINYGKKAISILEKDSTKNNLSLKAAALNITASAYTENKQADSAVIYQEKVLSYLPQLDSMDIKNTIVNIGYTYMELNQLEKARVYTEHGLKLFKRTDSDYAKAAIYTNLAMYGRRAKKYNYSLKMFDTAIFYTKKSNYLEPYFWIYDERSKVYKQQKKYNKAFEDLENLVKIKDSVFKNQRDITAQETEAKFETTKKEKEIAQQKEQLLEQELAIKNRNLYAILLASALLILAIIFFSIYKRNQLKRKQLQKEIDLKDALTTIKTQNRLQEQRLRISRDLHDNIGSQLTFIISSIDNLKFISKDANQKLKDKLVTISSFTSETIHQLRDTIWAMNKSEITIEDLHTRILSFVEKAKKATENIEFIVHQNTDSQISLTSLKGMNIFRVVQEAINNAIKYAEASKISVSILQENDELIALISDNGIGFNITSVTLGNGLSNMEKRMSEITGKVEIKSKTGKGTEIKIIL